MAQSTVFHTDGDFGAEVTTLAEGNWFGRVLAAPLDLSAYSMLKFDVKAGAIGTSGEIAIQVGPASSSSWCQGGIWAWTNAGSSKTIRTRFSDFNCSTMDLTQVNGIWVFLNGRTAYIDNVRAE